MQVRYQRLADGLFQRESAGVYIVKTFADLAPVDPKAARKITLRICIDDKDILASKCQ